VTAIKYSQLMMVSRPRRSHRMHEVTTKLLIFVDDKLMTDVTNKKSHARSPDPQGGRRLGHACSA
jgi:hypothetical protein